MSSVRNIVATAKAIHTDLVTQLGAPEEGLQSGTQPVILMSLVRGTWTGELAVNLTLTDSIEQLRHAAWTVLGPLALLLLGTIVAGFVAHQVQVGGLWVPGLLAPAASRFWAAGGEGFSGRAGRGLWSIAKGLVVVTVGAWAIQTRMAGLNRFGELEISVLARAGAEVLRSLLFTLAAATLVLGLVDFALRRRRFEAMLRTTPGQSREDQKAMDGDPVLRGRRRPYSARRARRPRAEASTVRI